MSGLTLLDETVFSLQNLTNCASFDTCNVPSYTVNLCVIFVKNKSKFLNVYCRKHLRTVEGDC